MRECASFRAGCPPKVLGSTALSRIGCMVNGPSWNRPVCSPLRNWRAASVTNLAVKWSIILHNRSLELPLGTWLKLGAWAEAKLTLQTNMWGKKFKRRYNGWETVMKE